MPNLEIPYDNGLLAALELTGEEFENAARFLVAARLFELGCISTGKGAEMAAMERVDFIMELGRRGIPVINLDESEIEEELCYSGKASR